MATAITAIVSDRKRKAPAIEPMAGRTPRTFVTTVATSQGSKALNDEYSRLRARGLLLANAFEEDRQEVSRP